MKVKIISSKDAEEVFDKLNIHLQEKLFYKVGIEGLHLNIIKAIWKVRS